MCKGLIIHLYCPRAVSWPSSLHDRPVCYLWWTELHGTGFSPITSAFACQYYLNHARCSFIHLLPTFNNLSSWLCH